LLAEIERAGSLDPWNPAVEVGYRKERLDATAIERGREYSVVTSTVPTDRIVQVEQENGRGRIRHFTLGATEPA
jgi:hypothetical protein